MPWERCRLQPALLPSDRDAVDGPCAATGKKDGHGHRDHQKLKFHSFAFLLAGPVDEHPELAGGGDRGDGHIDGDAKRRDPAEKTKNQSDGAKEFGHDDEENERSGKAPLPEVVNGSRKSGASEPAEHFLHAVRKHHTAGNDADQGQRPVIPGVQQFGERRRLLSSRLFSGTRQHDEKQRARNNHLFNSGMSLPFGGMGMDFRYA